PGTSLCGADRPGADPHRGWMCRAPGRSKSFLRHLHLQHPPPGLTARGCMLQDRTSAACGESKDPWSVPLSVIHAVAPGWAWRNVGYRDSAQRLAVCCSQDGSLNTQKEPPWATGVVSSAMSPPHSGTAPP